MTAIFGGGGNRKKKQVPVENTASAAKPNGSIAETDQQRQPSDKSSKEKLETPQEIKKTTAKPAKNTTGVYDYDTYI